MQYFEVDTLYDEAPAWAATALSLGYRWSLSGSNTRRIGLLSMPCESCAAGLIALGALRNDLERTTADHVDTYFDLLLQVCHERVSARMRCKSFNKEADWDLRYVIDDTRWRFVAHDHYKGADAIVLEDARRRPVIKRKAKSISHQNGACRFYLMRHHAIDWQLRDCPLPQLATGENMLKISDYSELPGCAGPIVETNLSRSYEGLVLVGGGGERSSQYMQKLYGSGFTIADRRLPLGDLLTLHHRERKYIQRLSFLNERTPHYKAVYPAKLVVADGILALLSAEKLFRDSDIIGVCSRDASTEAILQLKDWMSGRIRYYTDIDTTHYLPDDIPAGILLRVLQRRA
ncbi:hypothetical protein DVP60_08690 [Yersinia enterocolitica]|uniref:hypothetical protein n=1 Tax=Yersinia enterocolitica TaxID=630 RepID=UPI0021E8CD6D|nr:hypothetical protein [Yersinia enterocolitica]EKN3947820.1 hypothetical protein [Yersinia enterocolitica]EKN6316314.1 hypothetical protein [Yersinia enterocolitica]UYJ96932.1 hypothetical protein N4W06_18955 [Yersinia enterocolitica]